MAESILAYNSGTKIFLNKGFVQGQTYDMSFHLSPNKEITNDKIFEKTLKL